MGNTFKLYEGDHAPEQRPEPKPRFGKAHDWISAIPKHELSSDAKTLLSVIASHCMGKGESCYLTLADFAQQSGLEAVPCPGRRKTPEGAKRSKGRHPALERAMAFIVDKGMVGRERDKSRPGWPWRTTLLVGPRAPKQMIPTINVDGPRHQGRWPAPSTAMAPPSSIAPARVQSPLEFLKTTPEGTSADNGIDPEINSLIDRVVKMFPQELAGHAAVQRIMNIIDAEGFGPKKFAEAIWLVGARNAFPRGRDKVRGFRFFECLVPQWKKRPLDWIAADNRAQYPHYHLPSDSPPPPSAVAKETRSRRTEPCLAPGSWERMQEKMKREKLELEKEIGCEYSAKNASQPIGDTVFHSPTSVQHSIASVDRDLPGRGTRTGSVRQVGIEPTTFGFEVRDPKNPDEFISGSPDKSEESSSPDDPLAMESRILSPHIHDDATLSLEITQTPGEPT
jgi:hypothetical protein